MNLRRHHDIDDEAASFGDAAWFDDDLGGAEDDERPGRRLSGRRRTVGVLALVASVVAAAVFAAGLLRDATPDSDAQAVGTTAAAASSTTVGEAAAVRAVAPAAQVVATTTAAPAAPLAPSTTAAKAEVVSLQTVPAVRDLVVVVNGRRYSSAADGSIAIQPDDRHGTVTVIGVRAVPALIQAAFTGWADGVTSGSRALDELDGPVAQLGFTVSYRVQVMAGIARDGTVTFDSVTGAVDVPIGVPTFVPAARATMQGAAMTAEQLTYTARKITRGASTAAITGTPFTPSPEALWRVLA